MTNDTAGRMIAGPQIFGTVEQYDPHFFKGATHSTDKVELKDMTPAEITAYSKGYKTAEADGSQKDWG